MWNYIPPETTSRCFLLGYLIVYLIVNPCLACTLYFFMQPLNSLSDAGLIQAYNNGNTAALSELILRYKDQLYTSLFLLVKDKELAEDIFQDVFVRVINSL